VRPLTTLAALIRGIVGSHRTQLPQIATQVPKGTKPESRGKRLARWVDNATSTTEVSFVPYAEVLLRHLAWQTWVVIMDGSVVGRGCGALRLHVVYQGRALPLVGQVRQGKQGHCPEDMPMALVEHLHALMPPGARGVLLGDGVCDGPQFQKTIQDDCWSSVVRTGSHSTVEWDGEHFRCEPVAACSQPGTVGEWRDGHVTEEAYGPLILLGCWATG
jgi:hypothetical protein